MFSDARARGWDAWQPEVRALCNTLNRVSMGMHDTPDAFPVLNSWHAITI